MRLWSIAFGYDLLNLSMSKYDFKSILIGVLIGIIVTTSVLYLIGDIDIQTEIQLGKKEIE